MKCNVSCLFILVILFSASAINAQDDTSIKKKELSQLESVSQVQHELNETRVRQYLNKHNLSRSFISDEGISYYLDYLDDFGNPVYIKTFNLGAARTVGVDKLRQGGGLGVNLRGTGMSVGVWEVFGVRQTHQEFGNRVLTQDAASEIDNHATHVAGTIMAAGINEQAQGMSPEARALLFTANNDLTEMTGRAKPDQTSLLFSNHSYGLSLGWDFVNGNWQWNGNASISTSEDYRFGLYDTKSRDMDRLAFNAPYYLIVKSAGNDRSDVGDGSRPGDGPYDIIGTWGVAKNILTVGAVEKIPNGYTGPQDVVMSSFSSWGPTDDGRIKPDIVAAGVNLLSSISTSDEAYGSLSGTSMSAPNVTGSLALLQQLSKQETNNFLRSATLKALIAHTANKATNSDGPDYRHGWGLFNAAGIAEHIIERDNLNRFMQERVLAEGQTYEVAIHPVANTKVTVTIAWTDPEGQPSAAVLDPTDLKLVNDLDVRLIDEAGNEIMPYILTPDNPGRSAQRGDNFRDNIEKIELFNPEPRKYRVVVSHKNTLQNGEQAFSLIITQTAAFADGDRRTLYWIGGNGEWNTGSNWSLSSGGAAANVVPTATDRVVVDENSFNGGGESISLSSDVEVFSFTWLAKENNGISLNGHTLRSNDDLVVSSDSFSVESTGTFAVRGAADFDLGPNALPLLNLYFDAAGGNWTISDFLDVRSVQLNRGNLNLSGLLGDIRFFETSGTAGKSLNLDGAQLTSLNEFVLGGSGLNISANNAQISFEGSEPTSMNIAGKTLNASVVNNGTELTVSGANAFIRKFTSSGSVFFSNSISLDSLLIGSDSDLIIVSGGVVDINEFIDVTTTSALPVNLSASGVDAAAISVNVYEKFCFDFMNINNVNYSGEAKISVGLNSDLVNATGWLEQDCDDVLFADYIVEYNCIDGLTYFTDRSSGTITSYAWDFGDGNIASTARAFNQFTDFGPFQVSLTISNGSAVESVERSVEIKPNPALNDNKVIQNDNQLVSEKAGDKYQWFANNQLLEGEVNRIYQVGSLGGDFFVVTFNEGCNSISDTVVVEVTGIEDILPDEGLADQVAVYPIPVKDDLKVRWPVNFVEIKLSLMDVNGRTLYSKEFIPETGTFIVPMRLLPEGMYWLKIENQDGVFIRKVIK